MGSKFSRKKHVELRAQEKQLSRKLPNLFERNGRIKNYQEKINLKSDAEITKQKGR